MPSTPSSDLRAHDPGRPHGRRVDALRAALPAMVVSVVVAGWLWSDGRRKAVALALVPFVAAVVVSLVAPRLVPQVVAALARLGRRVGHGVVVAAAAIAVVLVVAPMSVVHALARTSPLEDGWQRPDTSWRTRAGRRSADARLVAVRRAGGAQTSLGPTGRWGRWRRRGVVLAGIALVAGAVWMRPSWPAGSSEQPDQEVFGVDVSDYAHEGEPWFPTHARELVEQPIPWDPFIGWVLDDYAGETVTVRDGRRVTLQPSDAPELTVWFFGGSTMYGAGQRDDRTIPSEIVRLAERDGTAIDAVNFGVPSFTNWQETQLLTQALQRMAPPDLIVFYDGVNEEAMAWERLQRGDDDPDDISRNLNGTAEEGLWLMRRPAPPEGAVIDGERQVELAAVQYARGVDLGRRLAASYGVEILHFWQPSLVTKAYEPSDQGAYDLTGLVPTPAGELAPHRQILQRSETDSIDLTAALDGAGVPVFWDGGHTNELGARIVAEAMYGHLRPTVEALVDGGR